MFHTPFDLAVLHLKNGKTVLIPQLRLQLIMLISASVYVTPENINKYVRLSLNRIWFPYMWVHVALMVLYYSHQKIQSTITCQSIWLHIYTSWFVCNKSVWTGPESFFLLVWNKLTRLHVLNRPQEDLLHDSNMEYLLLKIYY